MASLRETPPLRDRVVHGDANSSDAYSTDNRYDYNYF